MALINRPFENANPQNPRSWNQIDFGHYVVMGKDENGTPLLLDTQNPQRDWGNAPVTYRGIEEIFAYLTEEFIHGISVIHCESSPTMDNPIHREYHEDEGILGNSPIIFEGQGGGYGYSSRKKRKTSINKRTRKSKRRKSKTRKRSIRRKSKTRKRSIRRKSKTRKRSIRRKSKRNA